MQHGAKACASTAGLSSGCAGISSLSPGGGEALACYGDGHLSYFQAGDAAGWLEERAVARAARRGPAKGVRRFAACENDGGTICYAYTSGAGGEVTFGHARRESPASLRVVEEVPVAAGAAVGATCVNLSAATAQLEMLVFGTASGEVRKVSLRTLAEERRPVAEGSGPCCHAVVSPPYDPERLVMAAW